jgi:hypothetical protein
MYVKMAEEEDNKSADRWQKDADGILIFVSLNISLHLLSAVNSVNIIDWFILCHRCSIGLSVCPGSEAKFTGYLCILSQEHPTTSCRPERISCLHSCHSI